MRLIIEISEDCYKNACNGSYDGNDEIEAIYAIKDGEVIDGAMSNSYKGEFSRLIPDLSKSEVIK